MDPESLIEYELFLTINEFGIYQFLICTINGRWEVVAKWTIAEIIKSGE